MANFSEPSGEFNREFFTLIDAASEIVVTSHTSPDDDSIASVLGLQYFLNKKYPTKKVRVVYGSDRPERYISFAGFSNVEFVPEIADNLGSADLLIVADGGQYHRFSKKPEVLQKFVGKTICFDHHASAIQSFTLSLTKPLASSTSELIYYSFFQGDSLDASAAEILMLGLLGDTGDFTYLRPDESYVFDMAKRLLEVGNFEIQEFKSRYNSITPRTLEILKEYFRATQYGDVPNWPPFTYVMLTREFIKNGGFSDVELKSAGVIYISGFMRTIKDHPWGFVITPKNSDLCEISLRSLPQSVNVRDVAERMLAGGGHDRAAGGTFKQVEQEKVQPEACLEKVLAWIKTNKPIIS